MELAFVKMHGLGNDFIVIDDLAEELDLAPEAVEWFCDRNFGIGADGLILVRPATTARSRLRLVVPQLRRSVAEMCGNGIRCFAKYVVDHGLVPADAGHGSRRDRDRRLRDRGHSRLRRHAAPRDGRHGRAVVRPADDPDRDALRRQRRHGHRLPARDRARHLRRHAVSMGNPHCVLWVDDVDDRRRRHDRPRRSRTTRCSRTRPTSSSPRWSATTTIRLRVWERGVGETLACGTGACAAAVVGSADACGSAARPPSSCPAGSSRSAGPRTTTST